MTRGTNLDRLERSFPPCLLPAAANPICRHRAETPICRSLEPEIWIEHSVMVLRELLMTLPPETLSV